MAKGKRTFNPIDPDKIAEDENKEYFLRRKSNNKKSKSQYNLKT